jgi:hypothetical protein
VRNRSRLQRPDRQEMPRQEIASSGNATAVDDVVARAKRWVAETGVRVEADSILAARDAERR